MTTHLATIQTYNGIEQVEFTTFSESSGHYSAPASM